MKPAPQTKKRCAIYYRVSTDGQDIATQKKMIPEFVTEQGYEVVATYRESEEISGKFVHTRPAFLQFLEDAKQDKFDLLVAEDISRIMRCEKKQEQGMIYDTLVENKVSIHTRGEGYLDIENEDTAELLFGIPVMNRYQLPYGLDKKVKRDDAGKVVSHEVFISKEKSTVLRRVFDLIVKEGYSLRECTEYINEKGIPSSRGKAKWAWGALSHILANTGLKGELKTKHGIIKVPAIFTPKEFNAIRRAIGRNKTPSNPKNKSNGHFAFKNKIRCGVCGRIYRTRISKNGKYVQYCCPQREIASKRLKAGERRCSDSPRVQADVFDQMVEREQLIRLFMFPRNTLKHWTQANKFRSRQISQKQEQLALVAEQVKELEGKKARLLELYLDGTFSKKELDKKGNALNGNLSLLNEKREYIKGELARLQGEIVNKEQLEHSIEAVSALSQKAQKMIPELPIEEKRRLWNILLEDSVIDVYPVVDVSHSRPGLIKWEYFFLGKLNIFGFLKEVKRLLGVDDSPLESELLSDLSAGELCPLRVSLDKLGAAASPTHKSPNWGPNEVGD